ncbi:hypothetical protein Rhopal_005674-T1 [Rhodotorula paludigena]|uniref:Uncharacterized protein n=1 Tax=Rhodotorula paludigena TaxID=86838 RepID=A0AAV5GRR9_9BASI|nr:hypothetical protein Rhopal_005674-T1 [Rhodotorula paludigena]
MFPGTTEEFQSTTRPRSSHRHVQQVSSAVFNHNYSYNYGSNYGYDYGYDYNYGYGYGYGDDYGDDFAHDIKLLLQGERESERLALSEMSGKEHESEN